MVRVAGAHFTARQNARPSMIGIAMSTSMASGRTPVRRGGDAMSLAGEQRRERFRDVGNVRDRPPSRATVNAIWFASTVSPVPGRPVTRWARPAGGIRAERPRVPRSRSEAARRRALRRANDRSPRRLPSPRRLRAPCTAATPNVTRRSKKVFLLTALTPRNTIAPRVKVLVHESVSRFDVGAIPCMHGIRPGGGS